MCTFLPKNKRESIIATLQLPFIHTTFQMRTKPREIDFFKTIKLFSLFPTWSLRQWFLILADIGNHLEIFIKYRYLVAPLVCDVIRLTQLPRWLQWACKLCAWALAEQKLPCHFSEGGGGSVYIFIIISVLTLISKFSVGIKLRDKG